MAIGYIIEKIEPGFNFNSVKFSRESDLVFREKVTKISQESKTVRGKLKIIETPYETTQETANYKEYSYHYNDWLKSQQNYAWNDNKLPGFYKLKIGENSNKITQNKDELSLTFSAPVFVKFFKGKYEKIPEIKKTGEPYQEARENISEEEITDWMPLYFSQSYRETVFHVIPSEWRKQYMVESVVYVFENNLEILETI